MPTFRATLVAALALLAAGCGSGPRVDYAEQVNAEARKLNAALIALGTAVSQNADARAIGRRLDQQAEVVEQSVERLRRIDPPDGAGRAHAKLVDGVDDYLATMRRASRVAATGDLAALTTALRAITDGTGAGARKIREARDELAEEGFSVSGT